MGTSQMEMIDHLSGKFWLQQPGEPKRAKADIRNSPRASTCSKYFERSSESPLTFYFCLGNSHYEPNVLDKLKKTSRNVRLPMTKQFKTLEPHPDTPPVSPPSQLAYRHPISPSSTLLVDAFHWRWRIRWHFYGEGVEGEGGWTFSIEQRGKGRLVVLCMSRGILKVLWFPPQTLFRRSPSIYQSLLEPHSFSRRSFFVLFYIL